MILLNSYQRSVRNETDDRPDLYAKVVQLFKNDADLLEEFKSFLPSVFSAHEREKTKRYKTDPAKVSVLFVPFERVSCRRRSRLCQCETPPNFH